MHNSQTHSSIRLPLSWTQTQTLEQPQFNMVDLPFSSSKWIPLADVPQSISFEKLYDEHLKSLPQNLVLQSLNTSMRDFLIKKGWQVAPMGAEAILDLPWRGKRSVRELARRGKRHGFIREIQPTALNQKKLAQLIKASPSRQNALLNFTERPELDENTRGFVFESFNHQWLGAITLSTPSSNYAHTELLLRHQKAPNGVMEALVTAIANLLTEEGFTHLSLGNVSPLPIEEAESLFAPLRHPNELFQRSLTLFKFGKSLNFAYNAEGLWRFKNKFSPRWEPLYLAASHRLSWITMIGLAQKMGYFNLLIDQIQKSVPISMPTIKFGYPLQESAEPFAIWRLAQN